ncbi:MAG: biopolymer transporter ExbD [Cytophagia bacterium]|nr:MAG: biopolymer transporter ExbD [Cytophagales bacterium]TAG03130.1 MAG: biopolymer transporter ExbD [Cytophagia bacterium]TAG39604.1 MAG: biopolymer transporter ExbD [Cytophagia bacterium]TAH28827.1 MAG: biopolymer transporter ExbD [Cytophagales bacterium]
MNIQPRNKLETTFSLTSMTDIIFQLLIFFMLTSSFINPAVLPINLPSSKASTTITPKVQIMITKEKKYFVNDELVTKEKLEEKIKTALRNASEPIIVLNVDKSVPTEYFVYAASIATKLDAKISIATNPDGQ